MTARSVVAPLWQDRPGAENLAVATTAASVGFRSIWIGEMATYDAFALATAIGRDTTLDITVGPLAVGVRTPMTMGMGIASVSDLIGRRVGLAIGASSPLVVEGWHGRRWSATASHLGETAAIVRSILAGERTQHQGSQSSSRGYSLRLPAPGCHLTVAGFGPATLELAGRLADRVVLNMVTVATARRLVGIVARSARGAGLTPPPVAVWLAAAVDPTPADRSQLARARVGYVAAPGYGEMLSEAGFGGLVALARSGAHPREVAAAIPPELDDVAGLVGSSEQVEARISAYAEAGVAEVCLVPATAGDPSGRRTLEALAP